jgi:hypothetical protein
VVGSTLIKYIESLLTSKLKMNAKRYVSKKQYGFMEKVSIEECKMEVNKIIQELRKGSSNRKRPRVMFVDLKNAYDSVNREIIYEILRGKKILNEKEITLLKWIYENIEIKLGEKKVRTGKGVPQGLINSPILFNIYINSIITELESYHIECRLYADDMIVFTNDKQECEKAIKLLEEKTQQLKMTINKEKSGIIRLHKKKPTKYKEVGETEGGYPIVESYTYLDTILDYLGRADLQINKIKVKVERTKACLYPLLKRRDLRLNLNLFKVFIEPLYRMSCSLYATMCETRKKELIVKYRKDIKSMALLPKSVANEVI